MMQSREAMENVRPFVAVSISLDTPGDTILNYPGTFIYSDTLLSTGNVDVAFNVRSAADQSVARMYPGFSAKVPRGFESVRITNSAAQAGKIAWIVIGMDGAEIVK